MALVLCLVGFALPVLAQLDQKQRCGPSSVSTIPGCWGAAACKGVVAFQQKKPACYPNWCECQGVTAPYLTSTVQGVVSTDCQYSYFPTSDIPLTSDPNCRTAGDTRPAPTEQLAGITTSCNSALSANPTAATAPISEVDDSVRPPGSFCAPAKPSQTASSCETGSSFWALTEENWKEAEVDQHLYWWWHGGAGVDYGSDYYPPEPVRRNDGSHFGVAQQLPAQAAGYQTFNCLSGNTNRDCHSPTDDFRTYCEKGMIRWVYFAWIGMFHLWSILTDMREQSKEGIDGAKDASEDIIKTFQKDGGAPLELFNAQTALQILGSVITLLGVVAPIPRGSPGAPNFIRPNKPNKPQDRPGEQRPRPSGPDVSAPLPSAPKPSGPDASAPSAPGPSQVDKSKSGPVPSATDGASVSAPSGSAASGADAASSAPPPGASIFPPLDPGDTGALYGVAPGITISGASGLWQRFVDPMATVDDKSKLLGVIVNAIGGTTESTLIEYADSMFSNSTYADDLMNLIAGGWTLPTPHVKLLDVRAAWKKDIQSRVINMNWRVYPIYISFTDLKDGNDGKKCEGDKYGPQNAKLCADGGVYYLNNFEPDFSSGGQAQAPYGLGDLGLYNIDAAKDVLTSSVAGWKSKGLVANQPDVHVYDDVVTKEILQRLDKDPKPSEDLLRGLAGIWTLPVCDQGTNHWTYDYDTTQPINSGQVAPCACGSKGKDTRTFYEISGIVKKGGSLSKSLRNRCSQMLEKPKDGNVDPGWSGLKDGKPDNDWICYDGANTCVKVGTVCRAGPGGTTNCGDGFHP